MSQKQITLFDIPWEYILAPKILCILDIDDLMRFRFVSKTCEKIVDEFALPIIKKLSFAYRKPEFDFYIPFRILTFEVVLNRCQRVLILNLINCIWINDLMLSNFFEKNRSLIEFRLNNCPQLSTVCLQPLIIKSKNLRLLHLKRCFWMTNGALDAFTYHHRSLTNVELVDCVHLSEDNIIKFIRKFKNLEVLSLNGIQAVTDNTLLAISKNCTRIKSLSVKRCSVTQEGIMTLQRKIGCELLT